MFYEKELNFLLSVMKKCRIKAKIIKTHELSSVIIEKSFSADGKMLELSDKNGHGVLSPRGNTLYKLDVGFGVSYIYFALPESDGELLLVGPFVRERLTDGEIMSLEEAFGFEPKHFDGLKSYLGTLPILPNDSHAEIMLDSFLELIWKSPTFAVADGKARYHITAPEASDREDISDSDELLRKMKDMEARYEMENELISAVRLGQLQKEKLLFPATSADAFERRIPDLTRNAKNYSIIMNTLLRKAAEGGGVHPLYIDRLSSEFAVRIEKLASVSDAAPLMKEMFSTYCRLVRNHAMKSYPPIVRKTILLIDFDLSADISPGTLAAAENVSLGYLSSVFKKSVGKTVSEYIRERRVNRAMQLLSSTDLQIQTVALHCGIMDVHYFSKIFKRQTGKTPKEYREALKRSKI